MVDEMLEVALRLIDATETGKQVARSLASTFPVGVGQTVTFVEKNRQSIVFNYSIAAGVASPKFGGSSEAKAFLLKNKGTLRRFLIQWRQGHQNLLHVRPTLQDRDILDYGNSSNLYIAGNGDMQVPYDFAVPHSTYSILRMEFENADTEDSHSLFAVVYDEID